MNDFLMITLFLLLLALSAYFSAIELAINSSNKVRLRLLAEENKTAALALTFTENFASSISTILLGNNLANIALSSLSTAIVLDRLGSAYTVIGTAVVTLIILMFGEVLPKVLGAEYADSAILWMSPPFRVISWILSPFVRLFTWIINRLSPLWTPAKAEPTATVEELSELLDVIGEEGVFSETESDLIKSAIEISDVDAHDIIIPRVDMAAFDIEDGIEALLQDDDLLSYSRIPIYEGSVDNVLGVLSTRVLMCAAAQDPDSVTEDAVREILMPVVYAHMTRPISSILAEFRKKRLQVAIVVDEFGGTMGMLTLEDIVEEIVGEIFDETDEIEHEIMEQPDGSYLVDGGANLFDLFDEADYEPRGFDSDYTTVGGWATEVLDRFPEEGDTFVFDRFRVTVLAAGNMRVNLVRVELLAGVPTPENEDE